MDNDLLLRSQTHVSLISSHLHGGYHWWIKYIQKLNKHCFALFLNWSLYGCEFKNAQVSDIDEANWLPWWQEMQEPGSRR